MKKKINKQVNAAKRESINEQRLRIYKHASNIKSSKPLFQFNYELIAKTVNQAMQKSTHSVIIGKILQREPSKELIAFQEIEKNLVFQEYLQQYTRFDRIPDKMRSLIPKHVPNVKVNYMDFKIKNFIILNKYKVLEKVNLPYPLCNKFQKLTDSKMSSTKSVSNKVLQQLQKQLQHNHLTKRQNFLQKEAQKTKKTLRNKKLSNQKFQIRALTQNITQMIQNIKDVRALQNFKKEMQKSSQFKFGITNVQEKQPKQQKKNQAKQILKMPKNILQIHDFKQKQFKRKVQNDMGKYFPDEKKSPRLVKRLYHELDNQLPLNKKSKIKFSYKSTQRLLTNPDPDGEEYGLSIIRQRRKKSKSKQKNSKSRQNSRRSKEGSSHLQFPQNKRLETQYCSGSSQRLNTGYSMLTKSKSSSRIPTQYEPGVIIKSRKSKSKSKNEGFTFSLLGKKDSKSSSMTDQNIQSGHNFKRSKSKSKVNLLQFSGSSKILKK